MGYIVNKSGHPEIEVLANSLTVSHRYRELVVTTLIDAGFRTIADVAGKSVPETICRCPEIKEVIPQLHSYAVNLVRLGWNNNKEQREFAS